MKNLVPFFRALRTWSAWLATRWPSGSTARSKSLASKSWSSWAMLPPISRRPHQGWQGGQVTVVGEVEGKTPETMKEKPKKFMQRESWYSRKDVWKKLPKLPKSNIWNIEKILRRTQSLQQASSELSAPCTPNAWYACPGTNSSKRQPNLIWQT